MNNRIKFDVVVHASVFYYAQMRGISAWDETKSGIGEWNTKYLTKISAGNASLYAKAEQFFQKCMKASVDEIPESKFPLFTPSLCQLSYCISLPAMGLVRQILVVDYGSPFKGSDLSRLPGIVVRNSFSSETTAVATFRKPISVNSWDEIRSELELHLKGMVTDLVLEKSKKKITVKLSNDINNDEEAVEKVIPIFFANPQDNTMPLMVEWL